MSKFETDVIPFLFILIFIGTMLYLGATGH
jgi:hypothetical protein